MKNLALAIGLRYTRAKRKNHFISFISLISVLGIALGVAALITVLSVMNGFDGAIKDEILSMAAHVSVTGQAGTLKQYDALINQIQQQPEVKIVAPMLYGQGMLMNRDISQFAAIEGIRPNDGAIVSLDSNMVQGDLASLQAGQYQMIVGEALASKLGVGVGDKLTLVIPKVSVNLAGVMPRLRSFKVSGIFKAGFQYDSHLVFINFHDAQVLFQLKDQATSLDIKINDIYQAPQFAKVLSKKLGQDYLTSDWTWQNQAFFEALKLEKTLMFIMLLLIVAVAAFNILATLVMVVTDKQSEIAILRTLGASPRLVMRIFMVQGVAIGILGLLLGIVFGVILALNVTHWVAAIESAFDLKILSPQIYFISYVPSVLELGDVVKISVLAMLMCLLATLYPAYKASRLAPAEALRYE